jgi:hypothetical protein
MQSMVGLGTTIGPIVGVILFNQVGQKVWWYAAGLALVSTVCALIGMRLPSKAAVSEPVAAAEAAVAATPVEANIGEMAAEEVLAAEAAEAAAEKERETGRTS